MSITNPKEFEIYGKSSGTHFLQEFLPNASSVASMEIIKTVEDWNAVKGEYQEKGFVFYRVDYPIGTPKPNAFYGSNGRPDDVPRVLEEAKKDCPRSVILLMKMKKASVDRYDYDGGFNVLYEYKNRIIIELVSKAFDGHELTYGLAVHERYIISWDELSYLVEIRRLAKEQGKSIPIDMSTYGGCVVTQEQYASQYAKRLEFLAGKCRYDRATVEDRLPKTYGPIDEKIIDDLMEKVVLELYRKRFELLYAGITYGCVQGNFVNGETQGLEFFVPKRWAE